MGLLWRCAEPALRAPQPPTRCPSTTRRRRSERRSDRPFSRWLVMAPSAGSGPPTPLDAPGNESADVSRHGLLAMEVLQTGFGGGSPDRQQGEGEASPNHHQDEVRAESALGE